MATMLDMCSGRFGWSKVFAARGWKCIALDIIEPAEIPSGINFVLADILQLSTLDRWPVDFICVSTPCNQFASCGMKHFQPNAPFPSLGIQLFEHAKRLCEAAGVPFIMENVRSAQQFVGNAINHAGSFYLWGNAVPPLLPQGIVKGASHMRRDGRFKRKTIDHSLYWDKRERARTNATIPIELASCVVDYAEALILTPRITS